MTEEDSERDAIWFSSAARASLLNKLSVIISVHPWFQKILRGWMRACGLGLLSRDGLERGDGDHVGDVLGRAAA